jgi:hypothetical protein
MPPRRRDGILAGGYADGTVLQDSRLRPSFLRNGAPLARRSRFTPPWIVVGLILTFRGKLGVCIECP